MVFVSRLLLFMSAVVVVALFWFVARKYLKDSQQQPKIKLTLSLPLAGLRLLGAGAKASESRSRQ